MPQMPATGQPSEPTFRLRAKGGLCPFPRLDIFETFLAIMPGFEEQQT